MMLTIIWLSLFATLLSLASCQPDDPTPGPAIEQCVEQEAAQDNLLEQCLQHSRAREQNPTSLAVYCGTQCVSLLETAYTDCNAQDTQFLTRNCDDSFTQTIINAEFCVSQAVAASPSLQMCQQQFIDLVFEDPQSTPIDDLCTTCGQALGTLYGNCGPAVDTSSRILFGPTFRELFQEGCAQDSMGRYCTDMVRGLAEPNRTLIEQAAIQTCENMGPGDECTQACRDAINELGCCVHYEQLFRSPNDALLPLELCNIPECPVPFSVNPPSSAPNDNDDDDDDDDGADDDDDGAQCNDSVGLSVSLTLLVTALSVLLGATMNIVF